MESGLYILSICEDTTTYYLHITSCLTLNQCFDAGLIPFPNQGPGIISKFLIFDTPEFINLMVLDADP